MTLPPFLQRTPEQQADENARQQILRDLHLKGAKQTPAETRVGDAMLAEKAIRANLERLLPGSDACRLTELQLAESLADQGKYIEAAIVAAEGEYYEHYLKLAAAVDKDDDEVCECPAETVTVQKTGARGPVTEQVPIPSEFISGETFSQKHGKIVQTVTCAKCGETNIKPFAENIDLSDVEKH